MADLVYNSFKSDLYKGDIDLENGSIKCLLVTSGYVPDRALHTRRSDITNEVVGAGYTAGGLELTNVVATQDNADDEGVLDADDAIWIPSTITASGAVLYNSRGGAASNDELIGYIDFGGNIVSTAGEFRITWHVEGIINLG